MSLPDFRELYEQLLEYKGEHAYQDVLLPWQDNAVRVMNALKHCGEIRARLRCNRGMIKHLRSLYTLSRVSDILLLPFQKGDCDGSSWPGPAITAEERDAYFISLGMTPIEQETFHPFFHEIVEVTQSDDADEPITLDGVIWSGFMLGSLLFCRAGVRVRGGRAHIKKEIAEKSTLYFTFRRKNRRIKMLLTGGEVIRSGAPVSGAITRGMLAIITMLAAAMILLHLIRGAPAARSLKPRKQE